MNSQNTTTAEPETPKAVRSTDLVRYPATTYEKLSAEAWLIAAALAKTRDAGCHWPEEVPELQERAEKWRIKVEEYADDIKKAVGL